MEKAVNSKKEPVILDLTKVTGRDMLRAEQAARAAGDMTPMISLSMRFQAELAANVMGIKFEDLEEYPADKFTDIVNQVAGFLIK